MRGCWVLVKWFFCLLLFIKSSVSFVLIIVCTEIVNWIWFWYVIIEEFSSVQTYQQIIIMYVFFTIEIFSIVPSVYPCIPHGIVQYLYYKYFLVENINLLILIYIFIYLSAFTINLYTFFDMKKNKD